MYGNVQVLQSDYVPVAFSDHLGYNVSINSKDDIKKFVLPKAKPFFKISLLWWMTVSFKKTSKPVSTTGVF